MPVLAVTFDFWCTLFRDAHGEARQQIRIDAFADATGVAKDEADEALGVAWAEFERVHREEQRTLRPEDAVHIAADALGVVVDPSVVPDLADVFATAILVHSAEPVEGALEAVQATAARAPVGLISDTGVSPGRSLRQLLDRHDFTRWFTALTFSDEVGVSKPQAPMFERSARDLAVEPHELLHVGDLEDTDVAGAKACGAKAALFAGVNARHANETRADYVFHSWREFLEALPKLL